MNKIRNRIKLAVICCVVLLIGIAVFLFGTTLAHHDASILRHQVVEGLSFDNATLEYTNESKFTVEVTNSNTEAYNLKYIEIIFKDENEEETKLIGYIGETIEAEQTELLTAIVDKDITNSVSLDYSIVK